jgi:hypothetical protein
MAKWHETYPCACLCILKFQYPITHATSLAASLQGHYILIRCLSLNMDKIVSCQFVALFIIAISWLLFAWALAYKLCLKPYRTLQIFLFLVDNDIFYKLIINSVSEC